MKQLPNKMSELIRIALADLEAAEDSSDYQVDMDSWHVARKTRDGEHETCLVCLAGSVMAYTLGSDPKSVVTPQQCGTWNQCLLYALDSIREYQWQDAIDYVNLAGGGMPNGIEPVCFKKPSYERDPEAFKANMQVAVDFYESEGY